MQNSNLNTPTFTLLTHEQVLSKPKIQWLVPNVLKMHGLASIYGASGSGKTFLVLDLLLAIASGRTWFGLKSKTTPVTYVCLESRDGIAQRVKAWEDKYQPCPPNFKQIHDDFILTNESHVSALVEVIKSSNMCNGIIAIDTLNASAHGLDENSSRDMSSVIDGLKLLRDKTGCAVLIIHHSGKDKAQGMRGHSSLHAALDSIIEVAGSQHTRTWCLKKNKDATSGTVCTFNLPETEVDIDENGDPITSCWVDASSVPMKLIKTPTGKNQIVVCDAMRAKFSDLVKSNLPPVLDFSDALKLGAKSLVGIDAHKRNNMSKSTLSTLIKNGYFNITDDNKIRLATVN